MTSKIVMKTCKDCNETKPLRKGFYLKKPSLQPKSKNYPLSDPRKYMPRCRKCHMKKTVIYRDHWNKKNLAKNHHLVYEFLKDKKCKCGHSDWRTLCFIIDNEPAVSQLLTSHKAEKVSKEMRRAKIMCHNCAFLRKSTILNFWRINYKSILEDE